MAGVGVAPAGRDVVVGIGLGAVAPGSCAVPSV
jgi:hypothetical protein